MSADGIAFGAFEAIRDAVRRSPDHLPARADDAVATVTGFVNSNATNLPSSLLDHAAATEPDPNDQRIVSVSVPAGDATTTINYTVPEQRVLPGRFASLQLTVATGGWAVTRTLGSWHPVRHENRGVTESDLTDAEGALFGTTMYRSRRRPPPNRCGRRYSDEQALGAGDPRCGGGTSETRIKEQLKRLSRAIAILNLLALAAGKAGLVSGPGGLALGAVAAYGQVLARLYGQVSLAITVMDASALDRQIGLAALALACNLAMFRLGDDISGWIENIFGSVGGPSVC